MKSRTKVCEVLRQRWSMRARAGVMDVVRFEVRGSLQSSLCSAHSCIQTSTMSHVRRIVAK